MSSTANGANSAAVKLSDASLIVDLDLEALREFLQDGGYRAEVVTDGNVTFLRSATSGLPFDIRPGNSFGGPPESLRGRCIRRAVCRSWNTAA